MLIADSCKIIRMNLEHLRVIGRNTQGVKLINLEPGEKVVAMDMVPDSYGDDEGEDEGEHEEVS
jgi:DNA gyrase subunit A